MAKSLEAEEYQAEDWSGDMGCNWLANLDRFESMIAPIGDALLGQASYTAGERVIDLGCGGGATTIAIAEAVGTSGAVTGLDISPDLTNAATARAAQTGHDNIRFVCADAATVQLDDAPYDRLYSRFGSMFFDDPFAAFAHLHGLVVAGGTIDLAVWGPPRDNLWMMEIMTVLRNHVEVPPAIPRAPGPFAFEETDYLMEILKSAGFGHITINAYEAEQAVGGTGATREEVVEFALASMAAGRLLAEQGDEVRGAAIAELTAMFARYHRADEGVMMPAKAWLVSAQA